MAGSEKDSLILSDDRLNSIQGCLSNLGFQTGAKCILLSDIAGQLIANVGLAGELDVTNLVSLLAGGFGVTFEMAKYLGEKEAFNLNFHEGTVYDVYSANVGDRLFLTLIFDRQVRTSKIGLVWLYMKRAIPELLEIITTSGQTKQEQVIDAEFSASLSEKLDNLFT
jgi:predicted regulator of Ras-like GTPase activity (Roadblock/LC7/MglB family)